MDIVDRSELVSIHASAREATSSRKLNSLQICVSIHASAREATCCYPYVT